MKTQNKAVSLQSCEYQLCLRAVLVVFSLVVLLCVCYEFLLQRSQIKQQDVAIRSLQDVTAQLLFQAAGDKRRVEMMRRAILALKEKVCSSILDFIVQLYLEFNHAMPYVYTERS